MKKFIKGLLVTVFVLALMGVIGYLIWTIKPKNLIPKVEITKTVGESVPSISDFFDQDIPNGTIEFLKGKEKFDLNRLTESGSYEVKMVIGRKEYFSKLIVSDEEAPSLTLKEITLEENAKYLPISFLESCNDNSQEECILSFKEETMANCNSIGEYEIEIVAKDKSGNETQAKTKLTITKKNTNSSSTPNNNQSKTLLRYTEEKTTQDKYQFGTKISTITTIGYHVFSDGTLEKVSEKTNTVYDYSGYHATT